MDPRNEEDWLAYRRHLRALNRSPRTIQSYEESIAQFAEFLRGTPVLEAAREDVQDFIDQLLGWARTTTVGVRYRSLRAYFNWAVAEEIIGKSPMARMEEPKQDEEPVSVVDDDLLRVLIGTCRDKSFENTRDEAMIRLFCEVGSPRVEEMAGILLEDLDMNRDRVTVHGKGAKVRVIPFGAKTGKALDRYRRERAKHRLADLPDLWVGGRGTALTASGIQQMLRRRGRAAGIEDLHPHQLRHTAAHRAKLAGMSEEDMEELFGWTPGSGMVRRYGKTARTERAERAARRMTLGDRL